MIWTLSLQLSLYLESEYIPLNIYEYVFFICSSQRWGVMHSSVFVLLPSDSRYICRGVESPMSFFLLFIVIILLFDGTHC